MTTTYDAIVVGMGPGGAMAAYRLASKGLSVLGIDKATFPRYKSCGGCVSVKVDGLVDFDISEVVEDTVYGATFTYKSARNIAIPYDKPVGYNVMRDRFDNLLVEKARSKGAIVVEGDKVTDAREDDGLVHVSTDSGTDYKAHYLVGADGAGGVVGRKLFGLKSKYCVVSLTAELAIERKEYDKLDSNLFFDFGGVPYGYSWIFPKQKFLSVGIASEAGRLRKSLREYLDDLLDTHEALKGLSIDKTVGWMIPIYYSSSKEVAKGRCLVVGDAGHLVDPFLGEGIYFAMKTGDMAAEVIAAQAKKDLTDLSPYQDMVENEFYQEFEAAKKLSDLIYNHTRLWYATVEGNADVMKRYYMVIRGEESYTNYYVWLMNTLKTRPWKLAKSWVRSRLMPA